MTLLWFIHVFKPQKTVPHRFPPISHQTCTWISSLPCHFSPDPSRRARCGQPRGLVAILTNHASRKGILPNKLWGEFPPPESAGSALYVRNRQTSALPKGPASAPCIQLVEHIGIRYPLSLPPYTLHDAPREPYFGRPTHFCRRTLRARL